MYMYIYIYTHTHTEIHVKWCYIRIHPYTLYTHHIHHDEAVGCWILANDVPYRDRLAATRAGQHQSCVDQNWAQMPMQRGHFRILSRCTVHVECWMSRNDIARWNICYKTNSIAIVFRAQQRIARSSARTWNWRWRRAETQRCRATRNATQRDSWLGLRRAGDQQTDGGACPGAVCVGWRSQRSWSPTHLRKTSGSESIIESTNLDS